ncbi:MAG: hypothetical protein M3R61_19890 [Chloroflexota bacterium]|nr:hypothetical protein [Chloroflexota bacterium]
MRGAVEFHPTLKQADAARQLAIRQVVLVFGFSAQSAEKPNTNKIKYRCF